MKNIDTKTANRPFLSIEEAAEYLGISKATLYQYTHGRVLPHYKPRGKLIYFLREDLDQFIMNDQKLVKSKDLLEEEADSILSKRVRR